VLRLTIGAVAFWLIAAPGWALSPDIPLATVANEADLAVVAVLSDVLEVPQGALDVGTGKLTVETTVFGSAASGRELRLGWVNDRAVDCPRSEPWRHRGVRALWLLKRAPDGSFRADYPKQIIPLERSSIAAATSALRAIANRHVTDKVRDVLALLEAQHPH
jgi:hypothetical protein